MNYNHLERAFRVAVRRTLGANRADFDHLLSTCDPNEGINMDRVYLGISVELTFDPSVSPFAFFGSDITIYANGNEDDGIGDLQIFFGNGCNDTEAAENAAGEFFYRDASDGWYIEEDFAEDCGLHLMRLFDFDPDDESDVERQITTCLKELTSGEVSEALRSFVHYFED